MADYELPGDCRYTKDDEWVRAEGDVLVVGVTDYAQQKLGEIDQAAALTHFFVSLVEGDHLPSVRIALIVQMLRAQPLVFLAVDEVLNLTRHPAAVVNLEVLQQSLNESQLVVRVDDLEALRQLRFTPVAPQHAMGQAVERANPQVLYRDLEKLLNTVAHLGCRFVGKRDSQEAVRGDAFNIDQPRRTVHEYARLAATRARDYQCGFSGRRNRLTLRVIELFEDWCDVHPALKIGPKACSRKRESLAVLLLPTYADSVLISVILNAKVI